MKRSIFLLLAVLLSFLLVVAPAGEASAEPPKAGMPWIELTATADFASVFVTGYNMGMFAPISIYWDSYEKQLRTSPESLFADEQGIFTKKSRCPPNGSLNLESAY